MIYISGKITNNSHYKEDFDNAEKWLKLCGKEVINPVKLENIYPNKDYKFYMQVAIAWLEQCDEIYILKNYKTSIGAKAELALAKALNMKIHFENKQWKLKKNLFLTESQKENKQ